MDPNRHEGRVAIVTGGAHGIGAATVQRFLAEGASVVASDINAKGLASFVEREAAGDRLMPHVTDVSSLTGVQELVDATVARFGRLDVLVNNAGTGVIGTVEEITEADWRRVIDIDLSSVFYGAKAAIPHLRATKGNIVNTASISGLGANRSLSAYYAAKGGVVNFTRYLAIEYGPEGIRVNSICPGPVNTHPGFMDVGLLHDEYMANIPMKRLGTSEDMASAICFLASDDASYISGHNLVVDGALTAWTGEPDMKPHMARRALERRASDIGPS
jgi:meso-butanediol dehydrogenase/(S,S)-butanediol dehydrogenase/diacetyl reductase